MTDLTTKWLLLCTATLWIVSAQAACADHAAVADIQLTQSLFPPQLAANQSGFLDVGVITIGVYVSTWYDAIENDIWFYGAEDQPMSPRLSTVLPDSSFNTLDDCWYGYKASIPWDTLEANGGLDLDDGTDPDSDYYMDVSGNFPMKYRGAVYVYSEQELAGDIYTSTSFTRESINPLPWEVIIQKTVSIVTTEIEIYAAIETQLVLVTHAVLIDALQVLLGHLEIHAELSVATTIQWPFHIINMAVTTNSTQLAVDDVYGVVETIECSNPDPLLEESDNDPCTQHWAFKTESVGAMEEGCPGCILEGWFLLAWDVECFDDILPVDCPIDDDTDNGDGAVKLTTGDICPEIVDEVELTGTLNAYEDDLRDDEKNAFFYGQIAYFEASMSSDELDVIWSQLEKVQVTYALDTDIVYDRETGLIDGDCAMTLDDPDADDNEVWFHFTPTNTVGTVFNNVARFESEDFTVDATIQVRYTGQEIPTRLKASFPMKPSMRIRPEGAARLPLLPATRTNDIALLQAEPLQEGEAPVVAAEIVTLTNNADAEAVDADVGDEPNANDEVLVVEADEVTSSSSNGSQDWLLAVIIVAVLVAVLVACIYCAYAAHKRRYKRASVEDSPRHDPLASGSSSDSTKCVEDIDI